ncbi:hypothetical protein A4X13_0g3983 [Tilletia indica]|uniref:Uncharacterized protein n=1 Tax=Tilletia indica TaxID=43049 RepID=A0A177TES9_9BASI|nr:hypothetical protein A4X13_0g3983 [Tilletia indica]
MDQNQCTRTTTSGSSDVSIYEFLAEDGEVEYVAIAADSTSAESGAEFTDGRSQTSSGESTASSQLSTNSLRRRGRLPPATLRRSVRIRELAERHEREAKDRRREMRRQRSERRKERFRLSDSEDMSSSPVANANELEHRSNRNLQKKRTTSKEKDTSRSNKRLKTSVGPLPSPNPRASSRTTSQSQAKNKEQHSKKGKKKDCTPSRRQIPDTPAGRIETQFEIEVVIYRDRAPPIGVPSSSRIQLTPPPGHGTADSPYMLDGSNANGADDNGSDADDELDHDAEIGDDDPGQTEATSSPQAYHPGQTSMRTLDSAHPFPNILFYESD